MAKAYADPLKTRGILQSSVWGGQVLQVSVRDGRPNRRNKIVEKKLCFQIFPVLQRHNLSIVQMLLKGTVGHSTPPLFGRQIRTA